MLGDIPFNPSLDNFPGLFKPVEASLRTKNGDQAQNSMVFGFS